VWWFRSPPYFGLTTVADFETINHSRKQWLAGVLVDSKFRKVLVQAMANSTTSGLALKPVAIREISSARAAVIACHNTMLPWFGLLLGQWGARRVRRFIGGFLAWVCLQP
jgi:hypothetical protein